jgi:hypothetical protein
VEKKIHAGKEDGIFVHPQNGFNGLILNWCIGGCWFTPGHATISIVGGDIYLHFLLQCNDEEE